MKDNNNLLKESEEDSKNKTNSENKKYKSKLSSFLLLCLITTVGVMFALGLSFSAVKFMGSNETINTLISSSNGDDNEDKYIITYVENTGDFNEKNQNINGRIQIVGASFYNSTDGASGTVTYFGGLMLDTQTTFTSKGSTVTYKVTIKNESNVSQTFNQLFYNTNGDVKYTLSGIQKGDIIGAGKVVDVYLTLEYTGSETNFPQTIDSSSTFDFQKDEGIHITEADFYKGTNDSSGKVLYFGGTLITTENTFKNNSDTVTYKLTIKNDSSEVKIYNGLNYNTNGEIKYTISGIKEGDSFRPGDSKVVYLIVEYIGKDKLPKTITSSTTIDFSDFGISSGGNGIYLTNQFPTRDEIGKQFQGKNYVFNLSLLVGSKTIGYYYELTAVPNSSNTLNSKYVKLYLEKNGEGVDMSYRSNGRVKVFSEYTESENKDAVGKLIYKGTITDEDAKRGKIDFVMRMWITEDLEVNDETGPDFYNKTFQATVNTYAMYKK